MIKLKSLLLTEGEVDIISVASSYKNKLTNDEFDTKAECLFVSKELGTLLKSKGIAGVMLVMGNFRVDSPDEEAYSDWDSSDFNSEEDMEEAKYTPLHYWLEINGNILDITADQFNDELDDDIMPEVVFGSYQNNPRYIPKNKKLI